MTYDTCQQQAGFNYLAYGINNYTCRNLNYTIIIMTETKYNKKNNNINLQKTREEKGKQLEKK